MRYTTHRLSLATAVLLLGLSLSAQAQDSAAPPNSLVIRDNGNVGVGLANPASRLHVAAENAQLRVDASGSTAGERVPFQLTNNGKTRFAITNSGQTWTFDNDSNAFNISKVGTLQNELRLYQNGDLELRGLLFENSSRTTKQAITPVDPAAVLEGVLALSIAEWQYRNGDGSRHLGPMAEDFHAAFALGHNPRKLASLDTAGVALAAIQGLHQQLRERDARIAELEGQLAQQQARIAQLEQQQAQVQQLAARLETLMLGEQQAAR